MQNFISAILPVFNEEKSLKELHERLVETLQKTGLPFEIIFVNDGSSDRTPQVLEELTPAKIIHLKRNFGQTVALGVGVRQAQGNILITIDADLENDPNDIPLLLEKLNEGYDVVSGWRKKRWAGAVFSRRLPSIMANKFLSFAGGVKIHDFGCTLKAYRREMFDNISFSGDMHRLLLAYMARQGAKIAEIPVNFTPRRFGKSKYGAKRIFDVLVDILAFYFFEKYHNRVLHFFSAAGVFCFILSFLIFLIMLYYKFFLGMMFVQTPLPILTVSFVIVGFQLILMGLIAELVYRSSKHKDSSNLTYVKKEIINN